LRRLDRRVLSDVRELFGDRFRFLVTPGVGLDSSTAELLELAGVTVLELYGRPETAGAVSVALPADRGSGTSGRPLPGTEVRLEDEEVLVSGPGLMDGYHRRRHDTAAALDNGWLHTGDTGVLDARGRLRVLGRLVRTGEE
ncbi:MAG: AMP-binding protein, partial [Nocardioides sp.]